VGRENPSGIDLPASTVTVKVKVCGLTRVSEALSCAEAGVDWIGLNFHSASPRCVDPALAAEIVAALPASCEAVGLFVDRPPGEVAKIADRIGLRIIQLHGHEPPEDLPALSHLTIVRAFRIGDAVGIARMRNYIAFANQLGREPDAILVDADVAGELGGTGTTIALELFDEVPRLPRLILAGGLTPENVSKRVSLIRPWMVDVASGVESSPGRKDLERVAAFVRAARAKRDW
jgi:phosphoribosylanthranilate isomerase